MKLNKTRIIAIIAASGLLALSPALRAQEASKEAKPGEAKSEDTAAPKKKGGKRAAPTLEMYTEQLKLTKEQVPKVQAAMDERAKKLQDVPQDDRQQRRTVINEFNAKMKEILTADQIKTFDEMTPRKGKKAGKKVEGEKKAEGEN